MGSMVSAWMSVIWGSKVIDLVGVQNVLAESVGIVRRRSVNTGIVGVHH